ncbi:anti-sigma factor [Pseudactinotalea sp. Z1739]|uniref:anti-sigma factor n=1 Tax=Pseudactinotalea sp. Z1739 TaxID=3413028 RepID=UPI003C7ACEC8
MEHPDDGTLALLALGEQQGVTRAQSRHVAECTTCRKELEALRRVVSAGRAGVGESGLERPGEHVWSRISAELLGPPASGPAGAPEVSAVAPEVSAEPVRAPVPQLARRSSRTWRTAWVAAAAFLLGVGATVVADQLRTPPAPEVLATAELAPLPEWSEADAGAAALHEVDGARVLNVELDPGLGEGYREVWLIDSDLERLISLGVLVGSEGVFDVPDNLDMGEFLIVDVSDEPYDGDPAHSGNSIVRGELS